MLACFVDKLAKSARHVQEFLGTYLSKNHRYLPIIYRELTEDSPKIFHFFCDNVMFDFHKAGLRVIFHPTTLRKFPDNSIVAVQ